MVIHMRPSVIDVAKFAGVSTATVSRVLNDSPSLRPGTKKKVMDAIEQLGYKLPDSNLAQKGIIPKVVMILVPDISNAFYGEIVRGIESTAREHNYSILLFDTHSDDLLVSQCLDTIKQNKISGVISLEPMATQSFRSMELNDLPWISCSEYIPDSFVQHISIDHRAAAKDAVLYLISQGHRKIAFVNSDESYIYAQERRLGYEDALAIAGISSDDNYIQVVGGIDYKLGELAARRLMFLPEPPTAIFAVSDMLAIGIIKSIFRLKKKVPNDVAVIGFDDIPVAEVFEPGLTTISQPMLEMGQKAMLMILDKIHGKPVISCIVNHSLIIRESA